MEKKSLNEEQFMNLFLKEKISVSDVKKVFETVKYPSESLSDVRVHRLRIRDEYFTDFPNQNLEDKVAFVATSRYFDGEVEKRTFVWLPMSREVLIFEGEPFKSLYMPLLFPENRAFKFYQKEKRHYWRRFDITRFGIKAVEDFETIDGTFSTWKYYPMYFVRYRPF